MKNRIRKRREVRTKAKFERSWKRKRDSCDVFVRQRTRSDYPYRYIPTAEFSVHDVDEPMSMEAIQRLGGSSFTLVGVCVYNYDDKG